MKEEWKAEGRRKKGEREKKTGNEGRVGSGGGRRETKVG